MWPTSPSLLSITLHELTLYDITPVINSHSFLKAILQIEDFLLLLERKKLLGKKFATFYNIRHSYSLVWHCIEYMAVISG